MKAVAVLVKLGSVYVTVTVGSEEIASSLNVLDNHPAEKTLFCFCRDTCKSCACFASLETVDVLEMKDVPALLAAIITFGAAGMVVKRVWCVSPILVCLQRYY